MGFSRGPKIVTDGLVLALDVGNHKCVSNPSNGISNGIQSLVTTSLCEGANGSPGSGTHSPSTSNMPTYSSDFGGVLNFSGGKGINVVEDLGSTTVSTYSIWLKWPSGYSSYAYLFDARANGGVWHFANYANYNVHWNGNLRYNFGGGSFDGSKWDCDEWIHLITTSDSSGSKIWVNGSNRTSDAAATSSTDEDLGKNFRIGTRYTTSGEFSGLMGPIHLYKYSFTDSDALQMFNASKSRFNALSYDALATQAGW